jgi:hypothetical protein
MNLGKLTGMAKDLIDKRGGMDALKKDAEELKDIATGTGSMSDKATRAAGALKDPGAAGPDATSRSEDTPPPRAGDTPPPAP